MGSRLKTLIESPDASGRILGVNAKRLNEYPVWLTQNPKSGVQVATSNGMAITMAANSPSIPAIMRVSADGPVLLYAFGAEKTGACTVNLQLQDGRSMSSLMNSAINVATLFGSQGQPTYLPEALYLDESRALVAMFTDISGSANAIRPTMLAAKYTEVQYDPTMARMKERLGERQYLSNPYFYTFKPAFSSSVPAGMSHVLSNATNYEEIDIASNHYFELFAITATSTGAFALDIVQADNGDSIIDAPNGRNYAVSSLVWCGTANFPFRFHEPRLYYPSTKLLLTLTDLSGSANDIAVTLHGRAVATSLSAPGM